MRLYPCLCRRDGHTCSARPQYFTMAPLDLSEAGTAKKLMHAVNPKHWTGRPLDLRFVCPVSMLPVGETYRVHAPRDWLVKYGPALRVSLQILTVAATVAKIAFVLAPDLTDVLERATNSVKDEWAGAAFKLMEEQLGASLDEEGMGCVNEYLGGLQEQVRSRRATDTHDHRYKRPFFSHTHTRYSNRLTIRPSPPATPPMRRLRASTNSWRRKSCSRR